MMHAGTGRPRAVTAVGYLFIAAGVVGFVYHLDELTRPVESDALRVLAVRLLAVLGGVFLLRGANWARWLVLAWLAYHVALSAFHSTSELVTHAVLLTVISYALLRERASAFFRARR